ncbi:geranylgeranylglycerol-phosphate geranylgeranyltransferase [Dokdonia sp. 4H-3-7-5]|uniref:geranylgeranylglycerol-phosphate geranylgeranyltransferase n=1 Tax=Dokdonia sp. (strain 4H-3-7-5) TaxID=983548 RepID=UPI00020A7171|nr:geranylgeranylglycerol-phosphate geranylgeranyltransferase [Dokdonia sp. 4H-3-7-5]AEE20276.1 UbiA prenyltransferase [Dokdonia sp. 4H-3-7-5]
MAYLKIIRPFNLFMIFIAQLILKLSLSYLRDVGTQLSFLEFATLSFATLCIAAAGYIHNDIVDIKADRINKPNEVYVVDNISLRAAYTYFISLWTIGIILGIYSSFILGHWDYSLLFIGVSVALYAYNSYLQRIPILGNVVTSGLVAFSLVIIWLFEVKALKLSGVEHVLTKEGHILFTFVVVLAFMINVLRELVKDVQDINGDYAMKYHTLPIIIGSKRTMLLCALIALGLLFNSALFTFIFARGPLLISVVLFAFTILPLGHVASQCWNAEKTSDYKYIARLLKGIMLLGILLFPLILIIERYA